ncbi:MAG: MBL fold metallo-hydrolase [Gammaproteobacteria bacterium]|nr:MBL fold metallo-hydrolase [Gammaproteobacteria bacterium]
MYKNTARQFNLGKFIAYLAITILCIGSTTSIYAQNDVSVVDVTDNIKMLMGRSGNIGLFTGDDGTFMIDDKFPDMKKEVVNAIKSAGGDIPNFLINTHWHSDHTGGNESFGTRGSVIVAHDNVRARMSVDNVIKTFDMNAPAAPAIALPMVTYDSVIRFHLNGDALDVMHIPGAHTDGDSVVHFTGTNVIHAGDIFFNGFFPFIDTDHGGSLAGMIAGADQLLALVDENTKIIPGHGPLANKPDLQAYRDMLVLAQDKLTLQKADGKTLNEVTAMQPLAELDAQWGQAMFSAEKWISLIYESLP